MEVGGHGLQFETDARFGDGISQRTNTNPSDGY
jgi:hypothetical protein